MYWVFGRVGYMHIPTFNTFPSVCLDTQNPGHTHPIGIALIWVKKAGNKIMHQVNDEREFGHKTLNKPSP